MKPGEPYKRTHKISEVDINNHQIGFNRREVESVNEGFRYPDSVLEFQQKWRRQDQVHPTQKPVELIEWLIRSYSNEGDTILDNCMGSGTTAMAAIRTNRNYIGFETNEDYYNIILKRIEDEIHNTK